MRALFISDLHLGGSGSPSTEQLADFLSLWRGIKSLYILGDLFDIWVGDDAIDASQRAVADLFKSFSASGSEIYLMHGNRDFLIDQEFCALSNARLIPNPFLITAPGNKHILLVHGDQLCAQDYGLAAFSEWTRPGMARQRLLQKPLKERLALGAEARAESDKYKRNLSDEIQDVSPPLVAEWLRGYGASVLIHGHTHRPDRHQLRLNGRDAERIVLGDWGRNRGSCLTWDGSDSAPKSFVLTAAFPLEHEPMRARFKTLLPNAR